MNISFKTKNTNMNLEGKSKFHGDFKHFMEAVHDNVKKYFMYSNNNS